jgi:hypothetical protein
MSGVDVGSGVSGMTIFGVDVKLAVEVKYGLSELPDGL